MSQSLNHVHRSGGVDDGQHEFEREDAGVSVGVGVAWHAGKRKKDNSFGSRLWREHLSIRTFL